MAELGKSQDKTLKDKELLLVEGHRKGFLAMKSASDKCAMKIIEMTTKDLKYSCCLVTKSCPTVCNPMDYSVPRFLALHYLPEFAQIHVHWVPDAIQPSHPLWSPSPPTFNLSQHQCLFNWVSSLHQVAKVLELQLQHQSSNEYSGLIFFRIGWFDLAVQWISRVFSSTTVQKHVPNPGTKPASLTSPVLANRFFITSVAWEVLRILHNSIW